MKTKPTVGNVSPRSIDPYTAYNYANLPTQFDAQAFISPQAVASIHKAFTQSKTSHADWRSYKREGRFDPRRAVASTRGEQDIFKRKTGRSTTKVRVAVLIDASGSMGDRDTARLPNPLDPTTRYRTRVQARVAAAVFGATVCRALDRVPTVALDVYEHSAGLRPHALYIKHRWAKGTPLGVFNQTAAEMRPGGGNADGHALFAITQDMLRDLRRDERGVIMIVSDGMPSVYAPSGQSQSGQALIDAVAHARRNGIEVIAVAVDGSDQSIYYGKDGVVPFKGDWAALGTELARHIGKALARR